MFCDKKKKVQIDLQNWVANLIFSDLESKYKSLPKTNMYTRITINNKAIY